MPRKEMAVSGVASRTADTKRFNPKCTATSATTEALVLTPTKTETRIDSRLLAAQLRNQHHSVFKLIKAYESDFAELGVVRFQIDKPQGDAGGRPEQFALLNEDQSYLLLSFSKNTAWVRGLKVKLVRAFAEARKAAAMREAEYLPAYHALHDRIDVLAADSPHRAHVHCNFIRLLNKVAGIDAGQRRSASAPQQALLIVAQAVAAHAADAAQDHRDAYRRAKDALGALTAVTALEVPQ